MNGSALGVRRSARVIEKAADALLLRLEGFTYARIARRLKISRQRIQQLLSPPPEVQFRVSMKARGNCEKCGVFLGSRGHVHHKSAVGKTPEDYQDENNLQYLCISCHRRTHGLNAKMIHSSVGLKLRRRGIQVKDVARLAEVSSPVVSAWLRQKPVGASTHRKIQEAISKLLDWNPTPTKEEGR